MISNKEIAVERKPIGQGLKLALEMGPLLVFFLANTYGEELADTFPVLAQLGGKIFVGTAFFMVAMLMRCAQIQIIKNK